MPGKRSVRAGFTVVELVIAVLIVGIISAIAIPNYLRYLEKDKEATAISDINTLAGKLKEIMLENPDALPPDLATINVGNYLPLIDPWGNPYGYLPDLRAPRRPFLHERCAQGPQPRHPINSDFDLYSRGPDGKTAKPLTEREKPGRHRPRQRRGIRRQGVDVRSVAPVPSVLSHLRSSFGRRILLLFALCIAVPGAVFGYLSLRQVEEKFHQETMRRMRIQSREIGMAIHGGFSSTEYRSGFPRRHPWGPDDSRLPSIAGLGLVVPRPASPRRDPLPRWLPGGNVVRESLSVPSADRRRTDPSRLRSRTALSATDPGRATPPPPGPCDSWESPGTGTSGLRGEPGLFLGTRAERCSAGVGGCRPVPGRSAPFPDPAPAGLRSSGGSNWSGAGDPPETSNGGRGPGRCWSTTRRYS